MDFSRPVVPLIVYASRGHFPV